MHCCGFFVLKQHWIRLWNSPLSFTVSDNTLFMTVFQSLLKWCHFTKCYLSLQKWWLSLQLLAEPWPSCLYKDLCIWYKRGITGCLWESEWRRDARALGWHGNQCCGQLPGKCLRVSAIADTYWLPSKIIYCGSRNQEHWCANRSVMGTENVEVKQLDFSKCCIAL